MKLLIALPCLNEVLSLPVLINKLHKLKLFISFDLLVVDNNSTDGSYKIAQYFGCDIIQVAKKGKGNVVRKIIKFAKNKYSHILLMDCDQSYSPEDIPKLTNLAYSNPNAMIVGKRELANIPFLNKLGNILINNLLGVKDACSGMRIFPTNSFDKLKSKGFEIEAEMTLHAKRQNIAIIEVPVGYHKRIGYTKLKPFQDGFKIFCQIIFPR